MSINTKGWSAWINLMPGSDKKLIVVGEVETNGGNLIPVLTEAVPQGINPSILLLNLTIEDTGKPGTDDVAYRDVRFEKPAEQGQYTSVEILFEGTGVASIPVTEAH